MNESPLRSLLIFTDETVEAQRGLEKLLSDVFTRMGYEVLAYDLYQLRERKADLGEIIDLVKPQTVLWQLSLPFEQRLKEFLDAEKLKPKGGTVPRFILLSPVDENIIDRTLERRFGDSNKREIVTMPFDAGELFRIVANEPKIEIEPREIQTRIGKERK
ncbi:hypothetical protein HYT74_02355 [Candidatus Daviesbacteria bacterium]|nr:hypothetical protein [Candidatus Daviesbacteria bacterium]